MTYSSNPFTSIEERLERIEQLLIGKPSPISLTSTEKSRKYIRGISGLANVLDCSKPTAQRIKNSGEVEFQQFGRIIIFDEESILAFKKRKAKV